MSNFGSRLTAPHVLLLAVPLAFALLLLVPLTLPIGPFYWDLFIYLDAANRIFGGQVPSVDFFTPVGPLGYWLFAALAWLFEAAQPLLLVQASLLLVTVPLFALVLADVDRRSRPTAFALLVPFLVFSLLPFNVEEYYPYPGVDGFGIYNRQVCHLLYVLASALVFVRSQRILLAVIAGAMLSLFLVKVTGFIAGGMIAAAAFAAGRVAFGTVIGAIAAFVGALGLLELWNGVTSAYLVDIMTLVEMNEGVLLSRFLQAGSLHFLIVAPLGALVATLLFLDRREISGALRELATRPRLSAASSLFDRDVFWIGVATFAGLFFETQNTGGQALIFVWPMLLQLLVRANARQGTELVLILSLVAASAMPTFMEIVHRSARAMIGQVRYVKLDHSHLKTMGAVSQRDEVMERARKMMETYQRFPEGYQHLADNQLLPTFTLYTEPDFQLTWLMAADEAVDAILAYEAANGVRFETIMSLNFVNPFAWLLDRSAPLHIAIGADPFRAVPHPDATILDSVRQSDLILYPKCPITNANERLLSLYEPGLAGHRKIALSPCWDAYVRAGLAPGG